ncbi:hypothetical protein I7I48_09953 [Histoplasma ohiense]|nr:hypothetical protein I7I48_09953 [Histoplasma ohiense (nom. inval.)]
MAETERRRKPKRLEACTFFFYLPRPLYLCPSVWEGFWTILSGPLMGPCRPNHAKGHFAIIYQSKGIQSEWQQTISGALEKK